MKTLLNTAILYQLLLLLAGNSLVSGQIPPQIIWASDPVKPGETVVVRGEGFDAATRVEVSEGSDDPVWMPAELLQQTEQTLKFVLPEGLRDGILSFRIISKGIASLPELLNEPDVWWMQGDATTTASAAGWVRVFGLNLDFRGEACITLTGANGTQLELRPESIDPFCFEFAIPPLTEPGEYAVGFDSGESDPASRVAIGKILIERPAEQGEQIFNVAEFGVVPARPDVLQYYTGMMAINQQDCVDGVQQAIDAAGNAGGGVVYFPRGVYPLSRGLTVHRNVTLRGAGKGQTVLSWVDDVLPRQKEDLANLTWGSLLYKPVVEAGNPPHPFLIRGPGHFAVEDLAIYAVNHRAGIQTRFSGNGLDEGNVRVSRVVLRLNRFINNQKNPRHYSNHQEVFLKRFQDEPKRGSDMQGAIHLSGPNIEITDCDVFSSMSAIILNGASGHIARNRIAAVPAHWTIMTRNCRYLIFEENECLDGGVSLVNVHNTASNDGSRTFQSNFTREIYAARNSLKDSYLKDRDGGFVSDFHAPLGVYAGWAEFSDGARTTLAGAIEGSGLTQKWAGSMVTVVDGKGAGQVRFVQSLDRNEVVVDEPWLVPLDETSFISVSKTIYRCLLISNDIADAGNAVSLWGGGIDIVVAGNRSNRGGPFNQITLCHNDQFIPGIRIQFLDNVISDGINWGAAYLFPRESMIGTFTYSPLSFYRTVQQNKGVPVTGPDYSGPLAIDHVFRRNRIETMGCFFAGGVVANVLFEGGFVAHSEVGVEIRESGGRWDDTLFEVGPLDILVRNHEMEDVSLPYGGDFLKNARILP